MAIVHLFGGGFFVGNKNAGYIINDAKALGARGYTSISANYRLQTEGLWPAQIHDVKAAIRWTRANAESSASMPTGSRWPATRPAACWRSWPPGRTGEGVRG